MPRRGQRDLCDRAEEFMSESKPRSPTRRDRWSRGRNSRPNHPPAGYRQHSRQPSRHRRVHLPYCQLRARNIAHDPDPRSRCRLLVALIFEYINGFHDTANSIATVVATKVLTPGQAVLLAAVTNLVGAMWGTAVAKTISSGLIDSGVVAHDARAADLRAARRDDLGPDHLVVGPAVEFVACARRRPVRCGARRRATTTGTP